MIVSKQLAHTWKLTRVKTIICGGTSVLSLLMAGVIFVLSKNDIYQMIFLAEVMMVNFFLIYTHFSELYNLLDDVYVLNMAFLTKEYQFGLLQNQQSVRDMIKYQSVFSVSICSKFYTQIKLTFHNYCCESHDFIYILISIALYVQGSVSPKFVSEEFGILLFFLNVELLFDTVFISLGLLIEMPRRIRQYFRLKQIQKLEIQRQQLEDQLVLLLAEQNERENEEKLNIAQIQLSAEPNNQSIKESVRQEEICCAICQVELADNQNLKQLKCHPTHIFHSDCIMSWKGQLVRQNKEATCPICRKAMNI